MDNLSVILGFRKLAEAKGQINILKCRYNSKKKTGKFATKYFGEDVSITMLERKEKLKFLETYTDKIGKLKVCSAIGLKSVKNSETFA